MSSIIGNICLDTGDKSEHVLKRDIGSFYNEQWFKHILSDIHISMLLSISFGRYYFVRLSHVMSMIQISFTSVRFL